MSARASVLPAATSAACTAACGRIVKPMHSWSPSVSSAAETSTWHSRTPLHARPRTSTCAGDAVAPDLRHQRRQRSVGDAEPAHQRLALGLRFAVQADQRHEGRIGHQDAAARIGDHHAVAGCHPPAGPRCGSARPWSRRHRCARMRTSRRIASSARNGVATTLVVVSVPSSRARISPLWPVVRACPSNSFTAPREWCSKPALSLAPISCSAVAVEQRGSGLVGLDDLQAFRRRPRSPRRWPPGTAAGSGPRPGAPASSRAPCPAAIRCSAAGSPRSCAGRGRRPAPGR